MRLNYEMLSARNPAMKLIATSAELVRGHRAVLASDNTFLQWEKMVSDGITATLNCYRDWRDFLTEYMFFGMYRQPVIQALLGIAFDSSNSRKPGQDADHAAFVEGRIKELRTRIGKGGTA